MYCQGMTGQGVLSLTNEENCYLELEFVYVPGSTADLA